MIVEQHHLCGEPWLGSVFSTPESEREYRELFIKDLEEVVAPHLLEHTSSVWKRITDYQRQNLIHILYGMSFLNTAVQGNIFNQTDNLDLNARRVKRSRKIAQGLVGVLSAEERYFQALESCLELNGFDSWPVILGDADTMTGVSRNALVVNPDFLTNVPPSKVYSRVVYGRNSKQRGIVGRRKKPKMPYTYTSTIGDEFIRIGIEEGSHIQWNIEERKRTNILTLPNVRLRKNTHVETIDPNMLHKLLLNEKISEMDYYALTGYEFEGLMQQAKFTQKFDQVAWTSGYEEYYQKIVVLREDYLKTGLKLA